MRRIAMLAALGALLISNAGCFLNLYSSDPTHRTHQLLVVSENYRMIAEEWERIWFVDQPDHCTPYRTHGGLMPGSHIP